VKPARDPTNYNNTYVNATITRLRGPEFNPNANGNEVHPQKYLMQRDISGLMLPL